MTSTDRENLNEDLYTFVIRLVYSFQCHGGISTWSDYLSIAVSLAPGLVRRQKCAWCDSEDLEDGECIDCWRASDRD